MTREPLNNSARVGLASLFALCLFPGSVLAGMQSGAVFKSGQVVFGAATPGSGGDMQFNCDQNDDLIFTFTETVAPASLVLGVEQESGTVTLTLSIDQSCDFGSATFEYGHSGAGGDSLGISNTSPVLTVSLGHGASVSEVIRYDWLQRQAPSRSVTLFGDRITFISGDVFGQASRRRNLATISTAGQVVDTGQLPDPMDQRTLDAAMALNAACREAPSGSELATTCQEIREHATTSMSRRQAAEAFDPHQIASMPQAAADGVRLQATNIESRLSALRAGARGFSMEGLAFSLDGQRFDSRWLPSSLLARNNDRDSDNRLLSDRWGVFVNGTIAVGKRSRRGKESGFDFDTWGLTTGADYRFDGGTVAGLAIGYNAHDADFAEEAGTLDGDAWSFQGYGSVPFTDALYLDATLAWTTSRFDQERVIDLSGMGMLTRQIASGSAKATQGSGSLALNYRFLLDNGLSITPYGQFYYARTRVKAFSESGSVFALSYPRQSFDSQLWSAGLRTSRAINLRRGVLTPFLEAAWEYEQGSGGYSLQPVLVESGLLGPLVEISNPDRSFGRLEAGTGWVFPGGNQIFIKYSGLLFERDTTRHAFFVGLRIEL